MDFIRSILRKLNSYHYRTELALDEIKIHQIVRNNRLILSNAPCFVNVNDISRSLYGYGIPNHYFLKEKNAIDLEINNDLTYSDLIVYLSRYLNKISYLEIGVSVGKNFYQLMHSFRDAIMVGYEVEELNPTLGYFMDVSQESVCFWDAANTYKKGNASFRNSIKFNSNDISYVSADIFDELGWKNLNGKKFNLVLSDASHTPDSIFFEFQMLNKYNLIDNESFILIWDDLGGEMTDAFVQIIKELKLNKEFTTLNSFVLRLNGWIGEHESKHNIGIISNLSFDV